MDHSAHTQAACSGMVRFRPVASIRLPRACDKLVLPFGQMGRCADMVTSFAAARLGVARTVDQLMGIRTESSLESKAFFPIRRCAALEGCKWDQQVGDVTTLAP